MLEVKDAYKVLGLREGASRSEIEKKFAILLKKYKMSVGGDSPEGSKININEITRAYNILMGYEEIIPQEELENKKTNRLLQKVGIDQKKASNFFYYYKFHIIIGIVVLIVFITTLRGCLTRVDPELKVAFIGEFFYSDTEGFKECLKEKLPDIKEVSIDGAILSDKLQGQQEYAMQIKAVTLFAAEDIDVFILDRANFEKYAKQGAFLSLDDVAKDLKIDKNKNTGLALKIDEDDKEHLYGFDVSGNPVFEEGNIAGGEKIAAIGIKGKYYDNAVMFINMLLEK